jgi:hypothetical protein
MRNVSCETRRADAVCILQGGVATHTHTHTPPCTIEPHMYTHSEHLAGKRSLARCSTYPFNTNCLPLSHSGNPGANWRISQGLAHRSAPSSWSYSVSFPSPWLAPQPPSRRLPSTGSLSGALPRTPPCKMHHADTLGILTGRGVRVPTHLPVRYAVCMWYIHSA